MTAFRPLLFGKIMTKNIRSIAVLLWVTASSLLRSQAFLNANGPGNTFEEITTAFAPGNDTSAVEDPQCIHAGRHITEVWDADAAKYVYEFSIHVNEDNDRCINFDRQRVEIKTYEPSPASLKGNVGETILYKWRFKVPVGFQPSSNFTHIHQIKAVGGDESDPIFTFTVRKASPNRIEFIHNNITKVTSAPLSQFEGIWVECREVIYVDSVHGAYSLTIKKVSDGSTIVSYTNNDLMMIRSNNTFIRPKWGIYRSLLSPADLRDETLRFSDFYIGESATTTAPAAPSGLSVGVTSSTQIDLSWTDNATNEESYVVERSTNGTTWSTLATLSPNVTSYSNTGITSTTQYYYRVKAVNGFASSSYSATVASLAGLIYSAASGNWSSAATWVGGVVPGSSDDVIINDGHVVTVDGTSAVCKNLTLHDTLTFATSSACSLTVSGNITVDTDGVFMPTVLPAAGTALLHTVLLSGNLTCTGSFDARVGSGANPSSTNAVMNFVLQGSGNSTITLPDSADLNSVTVNKSGSGKVILGNTVLQNNNSSTAPSALALTNGIIETGNYIWNVLNTSAAGVTGGSAASHVKGALSRGFPSTGTANNKLFPMGDGTVYRPVWLSNSSSAYNLVTVRVMTGDANNGTSTLSGLVNVSDLRYYAVSAANIPYKAGASFVLTAAGIGYNTDDGVNSGNTNLRVALSFNNRTTWTSYGPTNHTTSLSAPPTQITSSALSQSMASGSSFQVALGNVTLGSNPLPVQLTSFGVTAVPAGALLSWSTVSEHDNIGFIVERKNEAKEWTRLGVVEGQGTTDTPHVYRFTDRTASGMVSYRLGQLDRNGAVVYSTEVAVTVGEPTEFALLQNFPNPFNPSTNISFSLPVAGVVRLSVYDSIGQEVAVLANGPYPAGRFSAVLDAAHLSSGSYFCRFTHPRGHSVIRMMLVR